MSDSVPTGDSISDAEKPSQSAAPAAKASGQGATADASSQAASERTPQWDGTRGAKPNPTPLWLSRSDQLVVGTTLLALVVLLSMHWLRLSRWGTAAIELTSQQPREYFYSLDINSASWIEWAQLDGIGEKLAKRIVADREERGPFRDARDLARVKGIHAKQLESMLPFLRGGSATEVASP